eukprot:9056642-Pyramimonas_sp.AAC.1
MHDIGDYKTAKEKGEQQPEHLMALDFVDRQVAVLVHGGLDAVSEGAGETPEGCAPGGMDGRSEGRVWIRPRAMAEYRAREQVLPVQERAIDGGGAHGGTRVASALCG